ncbi:MAG: type III-B CRISPR module RAMP protein Cmr4 [Candidatus Delongbacteria bacterium]|nr:type III-B CRISPR module RAMP protein Cmr4 [Candidatus Delongbacteria bacterium]
MYRKSNLLFLMNQTSMHAGSGDSLGIVDLPIQRERHTSFPKIEASSLKGSIREHFERASEKYEKDPKILAAFGTEGDDGIGSKAGSLGFTDARLLLFPVKSMKGVFAWIVCPQIIAKFNEELKLAGHEISFKIEESLIAPDCNLLLGNNKIVLEEYTFNVKSSNSVKELGTWLAGRLFQNDTENYFAKKLKADIVVLSDDDFKDFVNLSTEVVTRTQIDNETGTVKDGALFTEEYLPAESILYTNVLTAAEFSSKDEEGVKMASKLFENEGDLRKYFGEFISKNNVFQIGGNATLGKGIVRASFIEPKNGGN